MKNRKHLSPWWCCLLGLSVHLKSVPTVSSAEAKIQVWLTNCFSTAQGRKFKCTSTLSFPWVLTEAWWVKRWRVSLLSFDSSKQHRTKGWEKESSKAYMQACKDVGSHERDVYSAQLENWLLYQSDFKEKSWYCLFLYMWEMSLNTFPSVALS